MPVERRRRRHARNGRTHDSAGEKRGLAQYQGEASLRKLRQPQTCAHAGLTALRASARSSGVLGSSATGPVLREAFGCSTSLVDLVGRKACNQASYPDEDPSLALSKVTGAANRTTVLNDHGKHNPIAEVADFLKPDLQLVVCAEPVLKEAANGRPCLEVVPQRPPVEGRIFGEAAGRRVEITTIRRLDTAPRQLYHVGGRGLLSMKRGFGHRALRIADRQASERAQGGSVLSLGTTSTRCAEILTRDLTDPNYVTL